MTETNSKKKPYTILIGKDEQEKETWEWLPAGYKPDQRDVPNQRPVFDLVDQLRLRLNTCTEDCKGPHSLLFIEMNGKLATHSPFTRPYHKSGFEYEPFHTTFTISPFKEKEPVLWKFNITCGKKQIDPEFHVGSGGLGGDPDGGPASR